MQTLHQVPEKGYPFRYPKETFEIDCRPFLKIGDLLSNAKDKLDPSEKR